MRCTCALHPGGRALRSGEGSRPACDCRYNRATDGRLAIGSKRMTEGDRLL
jgi:hypothetical protein